jgi:alkylation response protein AidB-like acyl-CoA dehydrogenase
MRFLLDTEQRAFAASLDAMLTSADTPAAVRAWAAGDHEPGRALWSRLADAGVFALAIPEAYEGVGPLPVELAVAFLELGRHAVPGPLVETVATAAFLSSLGESGPAKRLLPTLASGEAVATLVIPGGAPYLLDGDAAEVHLAVRSTGETSELHLTQAPVHTSTPTTTPTTADDTDNGGASPRPSLDPARRLTRPLPGGELLATGPHVARAAAQALAWARLATAAQALGVGLALLDRTVGYVKQRSQFGVPIGSFQAVKHRLADAKIALEFARPLLFGAALSMAPADVAAAKVTACEAAYATARTALQLHGAIGYTAEYDLSLWLTKARALRTAWGSPAECRAAVLAGLSGDGPRS